MSIYRTKFWATGGRTVIGKPPPLPPPSCVYSNDFRCPTCNGWSNSAYGFRYHEHICEDCFKSGIVEKLDDIFIYFIENRSRTPLWRLWKQQWKFSKLEWLAYDAYRAEVKDRLRRIKLVRKRNESAQIDLKYTEEKRILERTW